MKISIKKTLIAVLSAALMLPSVEALAQSQLSGKVIDAGGNPVAGAAVIVEGTSNGVSTDLDGSFTIRAAEGAPIVVSILGYQDARVKLKDGMTVKLMEDSTLLEETVVVGYGTTKKATLTGAIAAIKSDDIVSTKNENMANMLAGKVSGLRVMQRTSEPGALDASFDIRGMGKPLIVIDGIPSTSADFSRLDGNEVDNVTILKDASAAVYGVRAANGVILVTTKKGSSGKATFSYDGSVSMQTPTYEPDLMDAAEYMTIYNEMMRNETAFIGGQNTWPTADIEAYRSGEKKSYDWYGIAMNRYAPMQQHNLSARGGSDKVQYYFNVGYLDQKGLASSGIQTYDRWNVRSNLSAELVDGLKAEVNIAAMKDRRNGPARDNNQNIYKSMWRQLPMNNPYVNDDPSKPFNGFDSVHPAVELDQDLRGYTLRNYGKVTTTGSLTYSVPFVNGLSLKALYSYEHKFTERRNFNKAYTLYNSDGSGVNSASPNISKLTRSYTPLNNYLGQISVNYENTFGDHSVKGLLLYESSKTESDNFWVAREFSLDVLDELFAGNASNITGNSDSGSIYTNVNKGLVGRANYSYQDKYLAEFSFRYDASSKFMRGHQWGFFPSVSVGWRVSEESFIKENPIGDVLTNLKLRANWGRMGDDSASSYQWMTGYRYPSSTSTVWDRKYVTGAGTTGVANENLTWYTSDMVDLGVDLGLWQEMFRMTFDWFRRDRNGLLATRAVSVPGVFGASFAQENLNSDMVQGFELSLSHRNHIGDFSYGVNGNLSYTRSMTKRVERADAIDSYDNWRNNANYRLSNIQWGYGYLGQFTSYDQIYEYAHYANGSNFYGNQNIVPGDLKIEDWNGDGVIDSNDTYPIGIGTTVPLWNYGMSVDMRYKGFDLNMLFQGAFGHTFQLYEKFLQALPWSGQSNGLAQFMDRWHTESDTANPFDPNTVWVEGKWPTNRITNTINYSYNSDFNLKKVAYMRLKSVELGYTLPSSLLRKAKIEKVRVYVNAYNLFTLSNTDGIDPERPTNNYGYVYPLSKTYALGVNLTF